MPTPNTTGSDFVFRYESYGFGCTTVTIKAGMQAVVFHASYVGRNPLDDFLQMLPDMVDGLEDRCYMYWQSEPGTLQVAIELDDKTAHLVVSEMDQDVDYKRVPDTQWVRRIDAVLPFKQIVDTVIEEAERNLRLHGLVGFSEDWCDHEDVFPLSSYLRLKGVKYGFGEKDIKTSSMAEELEVLKTLL